MEKKIILQHRLLFVLLRNWSRVNSKAEKNAFPQRGKLHNSPSLSGLFKKYSRSRWTGPQIVCYAESALGD